MLLLSFLNKYAIKIPGNINANNTARAKGDTSLNGARNNETRKPPTIEKNQAIFEVNPQSWT